MYLLLCVIQPVLWLLLHCKENQICREVENDQPIQEKITAIQENITAIQVKITAIAYLHKTSRLDIRHAEHK